LNQLSVQIIDFAAWFGRIALAPKPYDVLIPGGRSWQCSLLNQSKQNLLEEPKDRRCRHPGKAKPYQGS
jgi:hypothetical protein